MAVLKTTKRRYNMNIIKSFFAPFNFDLSELIPTGQYADQQVEQTNNAGNQTLVQATTSHNTTLTSQLAISCLSIMNERDMDSTKLIDLLNRVSVCNTTRLLFNTNPLFKNLIISCMARKHIFQLTKEISNYYNNYEFQVYDGAIAYTNHYETGTRLETHIRSNRGRKLNFYYNAHDSNLIKLFSYYLTKNDLAGKALRSGLNDSKNALSKINKVFTPNDDQTLADLLKDLYSKKINSEWLNESLTDFEKLFLENQDHINKVSQISKDNFYFKSILKIQGLKFDQIETINFKDCELQQFFHDERFSRSSKDNECKLELLKQNSWDGPSLLFDKEEAKKLSNLKKLDISHNNIPLFHYKIYSLIPSIETINLSHNPPLFPHHKIPTNPGDVEHKENSIRHIILDAGQFDLMPQNDFVNIASDCFAKNNGSFIEENQYIEEV